MTTRDDAAVGAASAIAARRWAVGRIPAGVGPKYPQVVVLMGATGDLSRRKLLPGLFQLSRVGFIPGCRIIGVSRDELDTDGFRTIVREALHQSSTRGISEADWAAFAEILDYVPLSAGAGALLSSVEKAEQALSGESRRLHYLSVPPSAALSAVQLLRDAELVPGSRIVMEKPFGTDLASAVSLNAKLHEIFAEDQIFRIDHFLGKEPAQTSWRSGLETDCSNRSGTGTSSTMCRSMSRRRSGSANGRVLRGDPGSSRHGGHSSVPDTRVHGDGATDVTGAGTDQRGEEQGVSQHAADRAEERDPGAIHRISIGGGCRPR